MLLFEFDDSGLAPKIVALTNQLKQDLEDDLISDDFTVDDLLDFFQKYDVIIDVNDLYSMIKVPPLKSLIKNIQGDSVVFVGDEEDNIDGDDDRNKSTVKRMAKHASKRK